jgi:hypothetical protein
MARRGVAIDGKTICRSFDRAEGLGPIHRVSAWAKHNGVSLGQVKTEEKSNEITPIPALLGLLELRDCIVTLDAMGCQRGMAEQIRAHGADYGLAVKANQKERITRLPCYSLRWQCTLAIVASVLRVELAAQAGSSYFAPDLIERKAKVHRPIMGAGVRIGGLNPGGE